MLELNVDHINSMRDRVFKTMKVHPNKWWVKRYYFTMKVYYLLHLIGLKSIVNRRCWKLWLFILRHAMDVWMKDGQMKEVAKDVWSQDA